MRFGIIGVGVGLAMAAYLIAQGATPMFRLIAFLPLWSGAIGIFQATGKT